MKRAFDEELARLKHEITKMSALAETMIQDAIKVLVDRDGGSAAEIREREHLVNVMQVEIDEQCLELIALHQPAARDLRFILGAGKTNAEIERLADKAIEILKKAEGLIREPPLTDLIAIPKMSKLATEMLKDSLHAFISGDVVKARTILMRDDELDQMYTVVTQKMAEFMSKDSTTVSRALALLSIARSLERIGDHATNIAENTIFVVEGRDVRHHMSDSQKVAGRSVK
jgi:phosphate transport system protein